MKRDEAIQAIVEEWTDACRLHPSGMHSAHEGYAVILEEADELWDEIKRRTKDWTKIQTEAVQVGAMVMRFLVDVCGDFVPKEPQP